MKRRDPIKITFKMRLLFGAIVGLMGVVLLGYRTRTFGPFARRPRTYDAGAVSEYWLGQQRRHADDHDR